MEGEHTPTIIPLILSTDLALIQLKDSFKFFIFPTISSTKTPNLVPTRTHIILACEWLYIGSFEKLDAIRVFM